MTSQVEVEGSSIDEAIQKGLEILGVTRDLAQVEILRDARRSLLGFGGQKALVRVSLRATLALEENANPPQPEESGDSAAGDGEAVTALSELLRRMGFEGRVEVTQDPVAGQMILQVRTESSGLLIGRHGQTLDALEYLLNRIIGRQEERGGRIVVDCENYRERRACDLRDTAVRLAEKARQRGKPQTTIPMSPRDRRIVHMALSNDSGVVTRSTGQGYFRRILITPARAASETEKT